MGNINPLGREQKFAVKGTASSSETKASSESASSAAIQENAEMARKYFLEKFGKQFGPKIADALDSLKKEGKFLTFEAVRDVMENIFSKDKANFQKYEQQINEVIGLFPHANLLNIEEKPKDTYDPFASEKVQEAMKKELRKSSEKMEEAIDEVDKERDLKKKKELEEKFERKRIRPLPKERI